eukprot:jgi/Bigna1/89375/estExt_fgenesh1_pg.C_480064
MAAAALRILPSSSLSNLFNLCCMFAERKGGEEQFGDIYSLHAGQVEKASLYVPELSQLADMLKESLRGNFETVETKVVQCPDLTKWGLAAPGICGNPRIIDIGGVPNLLDPKHHDTAFFTIPQVAEDVGLKDKTVSVYIMLLASSSHRRLRVRCWCCLLKGCGGKRRADADGACVGELPLQSLLKGSVLEDGSHTMEKYNSSEFGLLANLIACDGKQGNVVEVRAKKRIGKDNFVTCMRTGLAKGLQAEDEKNEKRFGTRQIGIGGVFKVKSGKVRGHVMPDFKPTVMIDGPEVEDWLQFYEMGPDLTCLSVFLTGDPTIAPSNPNGLDLRLEHTHFFSQRTNEGGHYHFDTTPDEVEYVGYFLPVLIPLVLRYDHVRNILQAPDVYRVANAFKRERIVAEKKRREEKNSRD